MMRQGAKQRLTALEKKGKSMLSVRKIRSYDEDFDVTEFAEQAVEIYRTAHEALTTRDKVTLHANVTGGCGGCTGGVLQDLVGVGRAGDGGWCQNYCGSVGRCPSLAARNRARCCSLTRSI